MLSGDSSWKGRSASAKPPPVRARPYRAVITSPHALRTPLPAPWTIEERAESFIVRDATGQALGYFYFEDEPGRRSADVRFKATAVIGCFSSETAPSRMTHKRHLHATHRGHKWLALEISAPFQDRHTNALWRAFSRRNS